MMTRSNLNSKEQKIGMDIDILPVNVEQQSVKSRIFYKIFLFILGMGKDL